MGFRQRILKCRGSMKHRRYASSILVLLCLTLGVGCADQLSGGIVDDDGDLGLGDSAIKAEKDAKDSGKEEESKDESDKTPSEEDSSKKDPSDEDSSDTDPSDKEPSETDTGSENNDDSTEEESQTTGSSSSTEESSTDETDETVSQKLSVSFTTKTYKGRYGPYHVGAVWVEKKDGSFVRTIRQWGEIRQRHLVKWKAASKSNTVDAVTGATLYDHQSHALKWDLRDVNGDRAADGDYVLCFEFTEENSSLGAEDGPSLRVPFELGKGGETLTPADSAGYLNVELVVP